MPRKARIDAPGALQHITLRGIERRKIFYDDNDRSESPPVFVGAMKMKQNLSYKDIIRFLRVEKEFLKDEFGVLNIGIFGSYVKGTQRVDSDIDLIVELKEPRFEWLSGLQIFLEQKFDKVSGDRGGQTYAGIARNFYPDWDGWDLIDRNIFAL